MKTWSVCCVCLALAFGAVAQGGEAQKGRKDKGQKEAAAPAATAPVALYDTQAPVSGVLEEGKWKKIAEGEKPSAFQGDAALVNDKVAAIVRKDGGGVDLYTKGEQGWTRRARIAPAVGGKEAKLGPAKVASNDGAEAVVETEVQGASGSKIGFGMAMGAPVVKASRSGGNIESLRIIAPCRIGILPDFFADDLMIDARDIKAERTEIPSDNFFLHMVGGGSCVVAAVWEKNERDVEVGLSGEGADRVISFSEAFFGTQTNIWAAALEHKGIWHSQDIKLVERDETLKGVELDWIIPFLAKWKANLTRVDGVIESSGFNHRIVGYNFVKGNKLGMKKDKGGIVGYIDGNGDVKYDHMFKAYVGYKGVMAAYPLSRSENTPLDQWCVDDLLRHCLGLEACGYVLDAGARETTNKGIFTCSYNGAWGKLMPNAPSPFTDRFLAAALKEERAYFKQMSDQVLIFVKHIEDRINTYVDFTTGALEYVAEQEKKHPELGEFIGRLKTELERPTQVFGSKVKRDVRANGEQVGIGLLTDMYKFLKNDTPDNASRAPRAGGMKGIGDPQDARVAGLRRQVKIVRSMATLEMAKNPAVSEIAKEIRKRSEAVLRNPAGYEAVGSVW